MSRLFSKQIGLGALTLLVSALLIGCEPAGPAEKAGKNLDKAGENLKDAVDPRGPGEKLGDKVDKAVGDK
jgi:hypothetical protein